MNYPYPYAVIASPGTTGSGPQVAVSCHRTREAAIRAARRASREYREAMERHGGTTGGYLAVQWGLPRWRQWWPDMPPLPLELARAE